MMHTSAVPLEEPDRREFLAQAARTLLGVGTIPLLYQLTQGSTSLSSSASGHTAQSVIYLYMGGGMSHIDTFDPKPGQETQGPVDVKTSNVPGIHVSEYLPQMAGQMDKVAVINSLSSTQGAHAQGRYFMHTSYFLRSTIQHPDLGAYSSLLLPKANTMLPVNVKIGGNSSGLGAGFLESKHAALPIGNPEAGLQHSQLPDRITDQRFQRRIAQLRRINRKYERQFNNRTVRAYGNMYEEAVRLMKSEDLKAFDITQEPTRIRETYGEDRFGQGCLLARRLVEHGVRFVEVDYSGWDTHTDNFDRVEQKCAVLDRALSSLLTDLSGRGLLESTLVVLATEFGRTPEILANRNGRNHYPRAFTCLLAGGGIQGGQIYGKTDKQGREVIDDQVSVPDFNATIAHALRLPLDQEIVSPSKRPFKVAADGKPLRRLFG